MAYEIYETFYGLGDSEKPTLTMNPDYPQGKTLAELRKDLNRMLRALDKPVLNYETREEI